MSAAEPTVLPFNMNDYVRVRLTDFGRARLREQHDELYRLVVASGGEAREWVPPKEDADGWSEWQLWSLMQRLGQHIYLGMPTPPFDTSIQILVQP